MPEHTPAPTPSRSLYGFFMYLFFKAAVVIYLAWSLIPDSYLHKFNIYYYPQKYWAFAVPIQLLVALTATAFIIYPSLNLTLVPSIDSINTIQDRHSQCLVEKDIDMNCKTPISCVCTAEASCMKSSWTFTPRDPNEYMVPQLHDLDIRFVSKKLYLNNKY